MEPIPQQDRQAFQLPQTSGIREGSPPIPAQYDEDGNERKGIPTSLSRRSVGAPEQFRKKIGNDLWINLGGNSEHAQSPKYRQIPWNPLQKQNSSRGSSSRPGVEASDPLNPSKFSVSGSRSNRPDQQNDDVEELRVALRRKELDYEKLTNEFEHSKARWEIQKEDIELERDELLATNTYLQGLVRGLKAESVCRENFMKHALMQTNSEGTDQILEEFRRTTDDIRRNIKQRDSELTAARRSDMELKKTLQRLSDPELQRRSEGRSANSRPSHISKQSSRQSVSAEISPELQMPPLQLSNPKNQPILIVDRDSSDRTLDTLQDCFQKLRYENGEFRKVIDALVTDRSSVASTRDRLMAKVNKSLEVTASTDEQRYLMSTNSSIKQQLLINERAMVDLKKHQRRMGSEIQNKESVMMRLSRQLENQSLQRVHAEQELCIYRLKCEQLQGTIEQLSHNLEKIDIANQQLRVQTQASRQERGMVELQLRNRLQAAEQSSRKMQFESGQSIEQLKAALREHQHKSYNQKIKHDAELQQLSSELKFYELYAEKSKDLERQLEESRSYMKSREQGMAELRSELENSHSDNEALRRAALAKETQIREIRQNLQSTLHQKVKILKEHEERRTAMQNSIDELKQQLGQKDQLLGSSNVKFAEELNEQRKEAKNAVLRLQGIIEDLKQQNIAERQEREALAKMSAETAQQLSESSVTIELRDGELREANMYVQQLEQGAKAASERAQDLQKQLGKAQELLRSTTQQLTEITNKCSSASDGLEKEKGRTSELQTQLTAKQAELAQLRSEKQQLSSKLSATQEQLLKAELKSEDYSNQRSDITELLISKNEEIGSLVNTLALKEATYNEEITANMEQIAGLQGELETYKAKEASLQKELHDKTAEWEVMKQLASHQHQQELAQAMADKAAAQADLKAAQQEFEATRAQLAEQLQVKDRLVRDRSKSLEMLLSDYNEIVESQKSTQSKQKAAEEQLVSTKQQLEAITLQELKHRLDVDRLNAEIAETASKVQSVSQENRDSHQFAEQLQKKLTDLDLKLDEAHTLRLHLQQTVSNLKIQLDTTKHEQEKELSQLNIRLAELEQAAATSHIEMELAKAEMEATELRRYELSIVGESNQKQLANAEAQISELTTRVHTQQQALQEEQAAFDSQSKELSSTKASLLEQQKLYDSVNNKFQELLEQDRLSKLRMAEMEAEIAELKIANEAELIQLKQEYEVVYSINEQLRATIQMIQVEKQKLSEQQHRQEVSALEISEIQGKSTERNRTDLLEDLPREIMQPNSSREQDTLTERIMDESAYLQAIDQLITRKYEKESQLLIRPLSIHFRKLYSSPRPGELIKLCEEFLEGVSLYSKDIKSRASEFRQKAKVHNQAVAAVLKEEVPPPRPKEPEIVRKLPAISKLSLGSDTLDKSGTRSADRKEVGAKTSKRDDTNNPKEEVVGQTSARLMKRPSMFVSNDIDSIFKQDEQDEVASVEQLEKEIKLSSGGDKSPQEMSQHSKQPSEIKSELVESIKSQVRAKVQSANLKTHINPYRRPTNKKPGKK